MAIPTEVTVDRLAQMLTDKETIFQRDPDDDTLVVPFENLMCFFKLSNGGIFTIHGAWRGAISAPEDLNRATQWVQEMNAKTLIPKVFVAADSYGVSRLRTESNTVVPAGMTDEQLEAFISVTVRATHFMVEQIEAELPHLVVWKNDDAAEGEEGK